MNYDMVIVGAGPSGATAARLLADKLNILILDKRHLSQPWEDGMWRKSCGGLLSPHGQKEFARLGLSIPESVLESPQPLAVCAIDLDARMERLYQRFYTNINREAFDRWLWDLIPEKVTKQDGCTFQKYDPSSGELTYFQNNIAYTVQTQYVVGADGANSAVRRAVTAPVSSRDRYIAIQTWHHTTLPFPHYGAFFAQKVTPFYGWSIPKKEGVVLGAAIPFLSENPIDKYQLFLQILRDYGIKTGEEYRREGALLVRPLHRASVCAGKGNVFLLGEAGGWISPSSAEGVSYALRTAQALAQTFENATVPNADFYAQLCWKLRFNLWARRFRSPFMFHPILRRPIMQSGLSALR